MARKQKGKVLINVNDIICKRLGKLEVIGYAGHHYTGSGEHEKMRHYYRVHCDCGTYKVIRRSQITSNATHSCGCLKKGRKRKKCQLK